MHLVKDYVSDLREEFSGYNGKKLSKDLMSGITVAAVALPLALAFGVSSGATAAAGLVTAIIGGVIISIFSGASFQISGPTGAMTAILVTLASKYGMQGILTACFIAGIILVIAGILRLGRVIYYIPSSVITGFTSGIALIIALGQLDNFFGVTSSGDLAITKVLSYFTNGFDPNWEAVAIGAAVMLIMIVWPKKLNDKIPSSLAALVIVLIVCHFLNPDVETVGQIPKSLFLDDRLSLKGMNMAQFWDLFVPALSIAALGMIESLLCGASAGKMKKEELNADRELVAQGIGNMIIPLFWRNTCNGSHCKNQCCHQVRLSDQNNRNIPCSNSAAFNVRAFTGNVRGAAFGAGGNTYNNCVENERLEKHTLHFRS